VSVAPTQQRIFPWGALGGIYLLGTARRGTLALSYNGRDKEHNNVWH
jgi:hypothetical protein